MVVTTESFEKVQVESAEELRLWLTGHQGQEAGVWVVTFKKDAGARCVSKSEVLDELLCVGRIDGIARRLDDERTMQLITPRRVQHCARSYRRVSNQVAGALAIALWVAGLYVLVVAAAAPWRGQLLVAAAAVLVIACVVRMEGPRPIVRRPARVR